MRGRLNSKNLLLWAIQISVAFDSLYHYLFCWILKRCVLSSNYYQHSFIPRCSTHRLSMSEKRQNILLDDNKHWTCFQWTRRCQSSCIWRLINKNWQCQTIKCFGFSTYSLSEGVDNWAVRHHMAQQQNAAILFCQWRRSLMSTQTKLPEEVN